MPIRIIALDTFRMGIGYFYPFWELLIAFIGRKLIFKEIKYL